jgi:hypothetical protein
VRKIAGLNLTQKYFTRLGWGQCLHAMTKLGDVMMFDTRKLCSALVVVLSTCLSVAAQQTGGTKVGVLTCRTSASLALIVGSHQKLRCNFRPDNGPPENYIGHINRLELDLGVKAGGVMAWGVFAPTSGLRHGALADTYLGGSGSASLGLGVGAGIDRRLASIHCVAATFG